jgi:S-DNA-T family DNA segregation ATPase FtsK/SpoIIIE
MREVGKKMPIRDRAKKPARRSLANEVVAVVLIALSVLMFLSLATYNPKDPSWNSLGPEHSPSNLIGIVGAYLSDFLFQLFGLASFSLPIVLVAIAVRSFFGDENTLPIRKATGTVLLLLALSGFLALFPNLKLGAAKDLRNGGALGFILESSLAELMNKAGAAIVLAAASVLTLMLAMEISLSAVWAAFERILHEGRKEGSSSVPSASRQQSEAEPPAESRVSQWASAWRAEWASKREARLQRRELKAIQRRETQERARKLREEAQSDSGLVASLYGQTETGRGKPLVRPAVKSQAPQDRLPIIGKSAATGGNGESGSAESPTIDTSGLAKGDSFPESADANDLMGAPQRPEISLSAARKAEGGSARQDAQAALRARAAKMDRQKGAEITMDPDVAEMVSTAKIVRTPSGGLGADDLSGDQTAYEPAGRRKPVPRPVSKTIFKTAPLDLLETPISHQEQAEEELRDRATILAEKCKEFSVTGHIHRINPGPVVTTFEFKPDPGVKYSRVVSLADDLCLALKAESIRIDRIPGKSTVGIEVPNAHRDKIYLREVIESPKFQRSESKLTVALGKTINGEEYVADLARMPHLLIAGATGAGKSVTLNALICSILYKATPEDVKFIMVDPKRLELGLYEGIPHLLTPIVTEPKRAANALKWATNEMENRYRELAKFGVRNIDQYNHHVRETTHPTLSPEDPNAPRPLPYIVIAIDELADLMMVARGEVETSIARLAQMARAVGIHLVVATQRPSVDVITGVIKANFPSRIAFRVSSKVDSRTIIDSNGAEGLLGQGDMLFLPPASSRLVRVHGSFVNEVEIKRITDHTRSQAEPEYNEEVTLSEHETEGFDEMLEKERDELFDNALAIVTDMGRASTSVLQRRLSIGYGRAAKILDLMERSGFIGPADGAKPRKVLPPAYEFRERVGQILEEQAE